MDTRAFRANRATMNVHAQEARAGEAVSEGDFVYAESTPASGYINSFVKSRLYQDGALRISSP